MASQSLFANTCGVDLYSNTGKFRWTIVSTQAALDNESESEIAKIFLYSSMRLLLPPSHHGYRLQHLLRPDDSLNSSSDPGIFVILAAVLNRYYNFTAGYGSLIYLNWYVGEAATAVFVANVPHLWPLLSRLFALGSFNTSKRTGGTNSGPGNTPGNSTHGRFAVARNTMKRLHDPSNEGYIRSELDAEEEERVGIAGQGAGMERSGRTAGNEEAGLELGHLEQGRGSGVVVGGLSQGFAGTAVSADGKEMGSGWAEQNKDDKDRIVKTVQIQQFSE
ncbi:MAG: hypothetical protein Q9167_005956 [Letrouitia subvulpina]